MTVVDSSVWIDHLNGRPGPEVALLRRALDDLDETIVVGDLVLFEVLAGLRSRRMVDEVRELFLSLVIVTMVGPELAMRAVEHFRHLRLLGITPRTIDLLIATYCVAVDEPLLTRDRDFALFAAPMGLRLARFEPN
jgi:predicted nucleic acid-binding protein